MRVSLSDLAFPLVAIGRDNSVTPMQNADALTTGSSYGFKIGAHLDMRLITVDARHYMVKATRKVGTIKRWWSRPIFLTLVRLELQIEPCENISLEEFKDMLFKAFQAHRDIWEASIGFDEFAA